MKKCLVGWFDALIVATLAGWVVATALEDVTTTRHPLDSLTFEEYEAIVKIVCADGRVTSNVRYPLVLLKPPAKDFVKAWRFGNPIPRIAVAYLKDGMDSYKVEMDLTVETITSFAKAQGQYMILEEENIGPTKIVLESPEMIAALQARGITTDQVYCSALSTGAFGDPMEQGRRLMTVTCNMIPLDGSSNWWSQPIEGLLALVDLKTNTVLKVTDLGIVPVASDNFGYTAPEIEKRVGTTTTTHRRSNTDHAVTENRDETSKAAENILPPFTTDGSLVTWDIWRFRHRTDKRVGIVLSQIEIWDETMNTWRSVLYEAHLSEVFVPYMDASEAWYFRTYMDSGEYGFGIFMTTLTRGIDCPSSAVFLPSTFSDDLGLPFEIPSSVCLFERPIGDPMWRHSEFENDRKVDGRPAKELVVRYASTVGNYDYLVDYIFLPDGTIKMGVGSTGIDAVKGVTVSSMSEPKAAEETRFGTLIAPNILGVYHAHFFNYRLDFDIDGVANSFQKAHLALTKTADLGVDIPRKSIWTVDYKTIPTEVPARTKINPASPSNFYFVNPSVKGGLGHTPGYQLVPTGSYAYSLLDITDPPVARNAYIDNQLYVTPYDPNEIYAGGEYAFQSDGTDTLHTWSAADRDIDNEDIVAWYTVGFHHGTSDPLHVVINSCVACLSVVPRMEDWPVMPLHRVYFQIRPFNFFSYNPAMSLPNTITTPGKAVPNDEGVVVKQQRDYAIAVWSVVLAAFVVVLCRLHFRLLGTKMAQTCEQQSLIPQL